MTGKTNLLFNSVSEEAAPGPTLSLHPIMYHVVLSVTPFPKPVACDVLHCPIFHQTPHLASLPRDSVVFSRPEC